MEETPRPSGSCDDVRCGTHSVSFKASDLTINGGRAIRSTALPLDFPGVHHMDNDEIELPVRVLRSRRRSATTALICREKSRHSKKSSPRSWVLIIASQ